MQKFINRIQNSRKLIIPYTGFYEIPPKVVFPNAHTLTVHVWKKHAIYNSLNREHFPNVKQINYFDDRCCTMLLEDGIIERFINKYPPVDGETIMALSDYYAVPFDPPKYLENLNNKPATTFKWRFCQYVYDQHFVKYIPPQYKSLISEEESAKILKSVKKEYQNKELWNDYLNSMHHIC